MNKYYLGAVAAVPFLMYASTEVKASEPTITDVDVTGSIDENAKGTDVFKNIDISITVDGLTNDNFLTDEGLHWSENTNVEIIRGTQTGTMDDPMFWSNKKPNAVIPSYSMNDGDSGRITNVGKTKSGKILDLIYTVKGTNKDDWEENSKYKDNGTTRGIGFVGEQYIQNSTGNSIVTVMSGTNYISMFYQIVEHGTFNEIPVVLSFITTDIDGAQGVQTNLDNLVRIIPSNADLSVDEYGIIYDNAMPAGNKLNGSRDLPKGGYLGAGFVSNFDYTFYAPAPKRIQDKAAYTFCARYDLFGSSLQAHVSIKSIEHVQINYFDSKGNKLIDSKQMNGINAKTNVPNIEFINQYVYDYMSVEYPTDTEAIFNMFYKKILVANIQYIDENGKTTTR